MARFHDLTGWNHSRSAAVAAVLIAGLCLSFAGSAQAQSATCQDASDLAILPAPITPWKGAPLRVIFAAGKAARWRTVSDRARRQRCGRLARTSWRPALFLVAEVATPAAGKWQAKLTSSGCSPVMRDIPVQDTQPPRPAATSGSIWPIRNSWTRETENLYSAWIEKLFDASLDAPPSWKALHEVLRDRSRNVLYNYLGLGEDQMGIAFRPDCADMPYFLRAYFSFKMGLPFGYSKCSRGTGGGAPKCPQWFNIQNTEAPRTSAAADPNQPQDASVANAPVSADPAPRLGLAASFGKYIPSSVTLFIPARAARRPPTTTPITIRWR